MCCVCPNMAEAQGYILELILIGIVVATFLIIRSHRRRRSHGGSLTPPSIPIIGHLHLLPPLPHRALHNLSTRYGPIFRIFLGSIPCLVVSTPEVAKQILKTHESIFCDRFANADIDHLTYGSKGFVFTAYGAYWKFMKKVCMSHLLSGGTLELLRPVRRSETMRFLRFLVMKAEAGEAVDVGEELMTLNNSIISRMIMGRTASGNDREAQEIRNLVIDAMEVSGRFNPSDYVWLLKRFNLMGVDKRTKQVRERFDLLMEGVIREHQEERSKRKQHQLVMGSQLRRDLLDVLLDIYEDPTSDIKLTIPNIKAFVLDLFLGGTDTSAITMGWALSELINHPRVMEKAREEIERVVGKSKIVEELDIMNLPYLEAIVKETFRIHPTTPIFARKSNQSCNIGGYEIPAKSLLFVNLWSIGRDPNYWEEPLEFRPERFMSEKHKHLEVRGQHFELMPFGTGRRACPGVSLALKVVLTNLAAMIQCFDWKLDGDKQSVDMQEKMVITIPRANPLLCFPVPRLHPLPPIH